VPGYCSSSSSSALFARLPLLLFTASMQGNHQIASSTALVLLVPLVGFMLVIKRFLKADVLAKVGS
jgi:putative spermidine/putrescine transport system permease protein